MKGGRDVAARRNCTKYAACLALLAAVLFGQARPAAAFLVRPEISLHGQSVLFYAGHLVLEASGGAAIDDGILHVSADRIIVDLRTNRYVALGSVVVRGAQSVVGDAFGAELYSHRGMLVSTVPKAVSRLVEGDRLGAVDSTSASAGREPLAVPDLGGEEPYVSATSAVAHLGADVRLRNAHVIVPSGSSIRLPSYVYTFSSDAGYVVNNAIGSNEDIPIFIGSTRDSILGIHFFYNRLVKLGIGLDDRIVDGSKAYDLIALSPLNGPYKTLSFTWQEQINSHASQSLYSSVSSGFGLSNYYDVRDAVHRSFFELTANQYHKVNSQQLAWQSFDQALGERGPAAGIYFHLRSEYGLSHYPLIELPFGQATFINGYSGTVTHSAFEAYIGTQPFNIGRTTLSLSADLRRLTDTQPHRQFYQSYGAVLNRQWNRYLTTRFFDGESFTRDVYPATGSNFDFAGNSNYGFGGFSGTLSGAQSTHYSTQSLSVFYNHGQALSFLVTGTHNSAYTNSANAFLVNPWTVSADVRFRLNRSLSLDLSRSYYFGFLGQRFSSLGVQILP